MKESSSPPAGTSSPVMDRNPSPPPDAADGAEDEDVDAIGDTVYSKHWLFSTLTRLINVGRLLMENEVINVAHVIQHLSHASVCWFTVTAIFPNVC